MTASFRAEPFQRPEFMIQLGLKPPYSPDDVKQAYRQKAKLAHPDAGGDPQAYMALHDAYEEALDYALFHAGRRDWIAEEMDRYIQRVAVVADVESRGGQVSMQRFEGLRPWVGEDFAQLKDKLIAIHLRGPEITDEALDVFIDNGDALQDVQMLDLAHSGVTGEGLARIQELQALSALDLHDTPVDNRGLDFIFRLPNLDWLHIGGTQVNWRGRMKLKLARPGLNVATTTSGRRR